MILDQQNRVITPEVVGNVIAKKSDNSVYGEMVYLGSEDSADNWEEIAAPDQIATASVAMEIMQE